MPSTSAAVALSASPPQVAMSPAPTRTAWVVGAVDDEDPGDDEPAAEEPDVVGAGVARGAVERCAAGVAEATAAPGSVRRTRLRAPNNRISVAPKMTTPSATDRAREPGSGVDAVTPSGYRDLAQRILEALGGRISQQSVEAGGGVRHEVDVERAHALLEHAPHRLAKVGHDPHQRQPGEAVTSDRAVVCREQHLVLVGRELVIDAEVAEVEERVAHPGVFPVDDPDAASVVDEVGIEQVVVARPELDRSGEQRTLDPPADGGSELVLRRDGHAARHRQGPIGLGDPERNEQSRDGRAIVDPSERIRDSPERLGSMDRLVRHRGADDEPRDEIALGPDEGGHLRTDTD